MKYRWKNGAGEWELLPIHRIKNSFLRSIQIEVEVQAQTAQDFLIASLESGSTIGTDMALRRMERISKKLSAIADEFYKRELQGINNFKNCGRIPPLEWRLEQKKLEAQLSKAA